MRSIGALCVGSIRPWKRDGRLAKVPGMDGMVSRDLLLGLLVYFSNHLLRIFSCTGKSVGWIFLKLGGRFWWGKKDL